MNMKSAFLLIAAVAAAGSTALFARGWISSERASILASIPVSKPETQSTQVLVASESLRPGSFVKLEDMEWRAWPKGGVSGDYVVKGERELEDFFDAVVRNNVAAGQPITDSLVVHPGDRGFLAAVLEPGKRAVSVPINATSGISGFVFPGDLVDIILTTKTRSDDKEGGDYSYISETLLRGIRVLATDQKVENKEGQPSLAKTATLEVTPKQVEKIALSLNVGSLSLSLQSLAREEDAFALASGPTAKKNGAPKKQSRKRSYTQGSEIMFTRGSNKRRVNVLHGATVEIAVF